jgi:hypothetical protein
MSKGVKRVLGVFVALAVLVGVLKLLAPPPAPPPPGAPTEVDDVTPSFGAATSSDESKPSAPPTEPSVPIEPAKSEQPTP